jgi:hypothetical protein
MRHPTDDVLRRLLAEPAGVSDADRSHAAACPQCLAVVDAAPAGAAHEPAGRPSAGRSPAGRARGLLRRPVAAAAGLAVVLAGASAAAAGDVFPVFQTERVAPVSLSTDDLVGVPDLGAYGDLAVEGGDVQAVPDAAAAVAATGLDVPEVGALPRGVSGAPVYQVVGEVSGTFRFSAERAAAAAAGSGAELPPPPPGLDGSEVRLVAGPGVAQVWADPSGVPSLVVGRAVAPSATSTGVSFETAREYLLSLPGLPADVAAQLRAFPADGSTLPLPVPAEEVTTSAAEVDGAPATVLATRDRSLAAVVWVTDGVLTAVAGSLDADEVLAVARGLG